MNETKNVDGIPDPRRNAGEKDAVNPDKFQKALKVEKSDETDKREKRNRPRQQEELEDEEDDLGVSIPVPEGLFKQYMDETEKGPSALDVEGGTKAHLVADTDSSSNTSSTKTYIGNVEEGQKSNISVGTSSSSSSEVSGLEDEDGLEGSTSSDTSGFGSEQDQSSSPPPMPQTPDVKTPQQSEESDSNINFSQEPEQQEFPSFSESKEPQRKTSKADKTEKPEKKKSAKTKTKTEKKEKKKKETIQTTKEKVLKETETKQAPPDLSKEKQAPETTDVKLPAKDVKDTSKKLGSAASDHKEKKIGAISGKDRLSKDTPDSKKDTPLPSSDALSDQQKDHRHKDSDDQKADDTIAPISVPLASPTGVAALEMSPFSNMPKDVFDLFEKMVGMMTIEKDNGKSTTTLTLNMKDSIFNKSELVLEHYDTAPHAYNVQLLGSPEAIDRFAKNMQGLNNAIGQSKLSFSIHVLPPKLSKNYIGRVSGTDSQKGDKEEKDGEESQ